MSCRLDFKLFFCRYKTVLHSAYFISPKLLCVITCITDHKHLLHYLSHIPQYNGWFSWDLVTVIVMMTILGAFIGSYGIKGNLQKHQPLPMYSWPFYARSDGFCAATGMWSLSLFLWEPFFSLPAWSTKAFITGSICSSYLSTCLPWVLPNTMSPSPEWAFHSQLTIHL